MLRQIRYTSTSAMIGIVFVASLAFLVPGCGPNSKVEQVERGIGNVKRHSEKIEDDAGTPTGSARRDGNMQ
jgi:hypothetical protein